MSRTIVLRAGQVVTDGAVLSCALWLALLMRFEGDVPIGMTKRVAVLWPYVVGLQYATLAVAGVHRFSWRYIGLREALRIASALAGASALLAGIRIATVDVFAVHGHGGFAYLPLGVIAINFALAMLGVSGVRVLRRVTTEQAEYRRLRANSRSAVPTLLVGAGRGGVMVAKEIHARPELGITPVGFIDDDSTKHGSVIHGLRVLGSTSDLKRIAVERGIEQALITISNAPGRVVREIAAACRRAGLRAKVVPGLYQIVGGRANLTRIRDVAIEDLLRRAAVHLDTEAIGAGLSGKRILVTGAGGSIGSEICRQVSGFGPAELILVERSENALFEIHRELSDTCPGVRFVPCIADITDKTRMEGVFATHAPSAVFHAAAHKHVPMMEWNPGEAVKNNVLGTVRLARMAEAASVHAFVMISTDKAVNPASVMGATKRVAEMYVQALGLKSKTKFVTVRFGNVLGSNGSVVPIFKEQIARGGPVKVTHPDMRRYFMTIPEACQLVLQAGSMGLGGEIFVLDMGEPVQIVDLARDLITLSGYQTDEIEIVFTGMRPGEKLYEELSVEAEGLERTRHPKVFIGRTTVSSLLALEAGIERLAMLAQTEDPKLIAEQLSVLVPEYGCRENPDVGATVAEVPDGELVLVSS